MRIKISMFVLPQEIDLYTETLRQLKRNSLTLTPDVQVCLDTTLCLSPELTNWEHSTIPRRFFEDKFNNLEVYLEWMESYRHHIEYNESNILGCVSKRREDFSTANEDQFDVHMWLDCDMMFPDYTLFLISQAINTVMQQGNPYWILTPQIVRIWDSTWDMIVNHKYLNSPLNFNTESDPYPCVYDAELVSAGASVNPISGYKFAGGWLTMFSGELARAAPIPDCLGHYGLEDLFIMNIAPHLNVQQYVINNLVVCENHRYRFDNEYTDFIDARDRKDEFRQHAHAHFKEALSSWTPPSTVTP